LFKKIKLIKIYTQNYVIKLRENRQSHINS